jgi:hypothetical protein
MTERMKNVFIYDAIRSPRTKVKDNGVVIAQGHPFSATVFESV